MKFKPQSIKPVPRTMREAFPLSTFQSLYTFTKEKPEEYVIWPTVLIISFILCLLIITGIIQ